MAAFQSRMLESWNGGGHLCFGQQLCFSRDPDGVSRRLVAGSTELLQRVFRRFSLRLSWLVCSRCRSLLFLLFLTSPSIFIPLPPHSHPSPVSPSLPLFILDTFFLLSFSILLPPSPQRSVKLCSAPSSTPTQFPPFLPLPVESFLLSLSFLCFFPSFLRLIFSSWFFFFLFFLRDFSLLFLFSQIL